VRCPLVLGLTIKAELDIDFDLVRIYHPDKVDPSTSSEVAHARFQAIATAYNALKTGSAAHHPVPTPAARAMYKRSRNLYSGQQLYDDSWKDRIIVASVIFVGFVIFFLRSSI
jgi:hypothetical protein